MNRRAAALSLLFVVIGVLPAFAASPRPEGFELRGQSRTLGQLPRIVLDDGGAYVTASRLAAVLGGSWAAKASSGTLSVGTRTAVFTKNQSRVGIAGQSLTLETPARVGAGGWLIPAEFLMRGLPKLAPGVTAVALAAAETKQPARTVKDAIALQELRYRSYPTFTRVVVETGAALAYAVVSGQREV